MTSTGEEPASDLAKFELGVSDKDLNDTYTNIGHILSTIIAAKMNQNFYEFLYELKPIDKIDNYMKRFRNDISNSALDLALRHNENLSLILWFLMEDAGELRNESENAVKSIVKEEDLIKMLAKQENDYNEFMTKTTKLIFEKEEENKIENELMPTAPTATVGHATQQTKLGGQVETVLTMTVNGSAQQLSIDQALDLVRGTREECERHLKATSMLRLCMEGLLAINEQNKVKIQIWRETDVKRDRKDANV